MSKRSNASNASLTKDEEDRGKKLKKSNDSSSDGDTGEDHCGCDDDANEECSRCDALNAVLLAKYKEAVEEAVKPTTTRPIILNYKAINRDDDHCVAYYPATVKMGVRVLRKLGRLLAFDITRHDALFCALTAEHDNANIAIVLRRYLETDNRNEIGVFKATSHEATDAYRVHWDDLNTFLYVQDCCES